MNDSGYGQLPQDLVILAKIYNVDDTVIIANDAIASTINATFTAVKEITLRTAIYPASNFRFKFQLRQVGGTKAYGQIYRNDIAIGPAHNTSSSTYVDFSDDITTINDWEKDDIIQLKIHAEGGSTAYAQNFKICGIASEFENTKES